MICFVLLMIIIPYLQAYLPPFYAKIDSVDNKMDCFHISEEGRGLYLRNNCAGNFMTYLENGTLNEKYVIVNYKDWEDNYEKYKEMEERDNKKYMGFDYFYEGIDFFQEWEHECMACPDGTKNCRSSEMVETEKILNGVNICNYNNLEDDTPVKYWEIKIYSVDDNQNITVKGTTYYYKQVDLSQFFMYVSFILMGLGILLILIKYIFYKKIPLWVGITSIGIGFFLFILFIFSSVMI